MPWRSSATVASQSLPRAVPPVAGEPLGTWRLESTADLRRLREALYRATRAPRPVVEPVVLVASELATNALHHGVPPVGVVLTRTGTGHLLDVADGSVDRVPTYSTSRPAGAGGFGLYLVGRLADELGWYTEPGHKHVWALLNR